MVIRRSVLRVLFLVMFFAFTCSGGLASADVYFVDNQWGDDNAQDGTGPFFEAWATIQHAINNVNAGDTIYVCATGQPYAPFTVDKEWIEIVGWEAQGGTTGLDDGSGVPKNYGEISGPLVEQPIIAGNDPEPDVDRENAIGITINADHVWIRNFDITDVAIGLQTNTVVGASLYNIYVYDVGDKKGLAPGGNEDGRGILLYGTTESYVDNCVVYNSSGYGISTHFGYFNSIQNCRVYCDDNSNGTISATHYYFVLLDENYSDIYNCYAGRYGPDDEPEHGGHGFCVFQQPGKVCKDNVVESCEALNMKESILMRGEATNNTFYDIVCELEAGMHDYGHGFIDLETGPHGNFFERVLRRSTLSDR